MKAEEIQKKINEKEREIKALKAQKESLENERNQSPVDTWIISTEGDCEGKSMRTLGTYTGHLGDILLTIADNPYYAYSVKRADIKETLNGDARESANLSTSVPRFHDLPFGDEDIEGAQKFFGPDYKVTKGWGYRAMKIERVK